MGLWDDISSSISGGSSSSSSSISLPDISFQSLSIPTSYSIPSYGSIPSFEGFGSKIGSFSLPTSISGITEKLNNSLGSIGNALGMPIPTGMPKPIGMPAPIGELQATTVGNLTQFQQDFNSQLTAFSTKMEQGLKPFLDTITDFGALVELLSNPETIIIIVAVVVGIAVAVYLIYKFYWKKVTYGESLVEKYTEKGLEAGRIAKEFK